VTIETLKLLQETVDYLTRLPVNPLTHGLCKKINAHINDPSVLAINREALEAEQQATTRVARSFTAAGQMRIEVVVTGNKVTCRLPKVCLPGEKDVLIDKLRDGVTLNLSPIVDTLTGLAR
jgi:hypothetical protein